MSEEKTYPEVQKQQVQRILSDARLLGERIPDILMKLAPDDLSVNAIEHGFGSIRKFNGMLKELNAHYAQVDTHMRPEKQALLREMQNGVLPPNSALENLTATLFPKYGLTEKTFKQHASRLHTVANYLVCMSDPPHEIHHGRPRNNSFIRFFRPPSVNWELLRETLENSRNLRQFGLGNAQEKKSHNEMHDHATDLSALEQSSDTVKFMDRLKRQDTHGFWKS